MSYKIVGQRPSGAKVLIDKVVSFHKEYVTVNSGFLTTRAVPLTTGILTDSEIVHVNGLIIKDDCYTIALDILTFVGGLNIAVGDELDIRYATQ